MSYEGIASPGYQWITVEPGQHRFLQPIFQAFGFPSLHVWTESPFTGGSFNRSSCGGLITVAGTYQCRTVAVAWSDFRVTAACYGRANSRRFAAFLRQLRNTGNRPIPLVYLVNSAGVSLMEGREVFSEAFALWPELLDYAAQHPVYTCAFGKCLGLAPILYGLGHYRMAVAEQSQLNLAGPEVIRLFFGDRVDFKAHAGAERFHQHNDLIHELVPSVEAAFSRFGELISAHPEAGSNWASLGPETRSLLEPALDGPPRELVPGWCPRLKLLLGARHGTPIGLFVNPLERSNNLITVRTLDKYAAGLDLFHAMRLPVVSLLDSPGIDPRFDQSEANNFRKMLRVGERIIRYPHGTMGVVTRRCYGGSASLVFPKVFGAARVVALKGSRIGTMHESIIDRQLAQSPRLLAQWKTVAARQGSGMQDLLEAGTVDSVIDAAELGAEIDRFLALRNGRFEERRPVRVIA